MRTQTREYLDKFLGEHKSIKSVLDVGSLATESGAHVKDIFERHKIKYTGIDMRKGDNVDVVINGHNLDKRFKKNSFDLVICFDTFEHDDAWWLTLEQMKYVLKRDGWMMIGAPSRYCPEHNHPRDYWRFMPQAFNVWFRGFQNTKTMVDKREDMEDEVYGWGQKP